MKALPVLATLILTMVVLLPAAYSEEAETVRYVQHGHA